MLRRVRRVVRDARVGLRGTSENLMERHWRREDTDVPAHC